MFSSEQAVRYERGGRFHNSRTGFTGSGNLDYALSLGPCSVNEIIGNSVVHL